MLKNMKKYIKNKNNDQWGFMALTSVAVMGAFFIIIFIGMFFSSTEELDREVDRENSLQALYLSDSCVKIGLNELKKDLDYFGGNFRDFNPGSCEVVDAYNHFEDNNLKVIEARGGGCSI